MRDVVNIVVGIFWNIIFRFWCRIFVEVMVYLVYEDVMFWSMDTVVFHYIKLQRVVFFH